MKTLFVCAALVLSLAACSPNVVDADGTAPLVQPSAELDKLSGFAGTYVIVDARQASDVAGQPMPTGIGNDSPIGNEIIFTRNGIEMEGMACDNWVILPDANARLNVETDPNLADTVMPPVDVSASRGDQSVHAGFEMLCEGERFAGLHKVDDRVLIMPWQNSRVNLILERPLTPLQIKAYQSQLKSMKFYDGEISGELDGPTLSASRFYYEYRAELGDIDPLPARPAITENLLDGLRVLN